MDSEISITNLGFCPRQLSRDEVSMESTCPSLLDCMEKMIKEQKFTDIKILTSEEDFDCHLLVLRCYSRYFERIDDETTVVELPSDQVTSSAFAIIYEWMTNDSKSIKRPHFVEVFKAAKFLQIDELITQSMDVIDDRKLTDQRESLSLFLEAIENNENVIKEIMMKRIETIFLTFVASLEFLDLKFQDVHDLLKLNSIAVNSELDIFFSAMLWLECDWYNRKIHLIPLMKCVRFELFQPWQLVELKKCPKEFQELLDNEEIFDMLDDALASISLSKSNFSIGDFLRDSKSIVIKRRSIIDPLWKSYNFEDNSNFYENYQNFSIYLQKISGNHWQMMQLRETNKKSFVQ